MKKGQASEPKDARERLLDSAEKFFSHKGFVDITLRDITAELGLSHPAIYYHFPGGKAALFEAVTERNILRHGEGLRSGMESGGLSLKGKLRGAASWLLSQPAMDLLRMASSDMPALPPETAKKLMDLIYEQIILRLSRVLKEAAKNGEILPDTDCGLVAGAFLGMVESLFAMPDFAVSVSREDMAFRLLEIILKGLEYREGGTDERR